MKSENEILKNLKKFKINDFSIFNLSILSDSSTQYLDKFIRAYGFEKQINVKIWNAPIDQIEQQIFNHKSLYHKEK